MFNNVLKNNTKNKYCNDMKVVCVQSVNGNNLEINKKNNCWYDYSENGGLVRIQALVDMTGRKKERW